MNTDEMMVTIPVYRFEELVKTEIWYQDLRYSILNLVEKSVLNWNKEDLDFNNEDVRFLIKKHDEELYESRVKKLNKEKEENE